MCILLLYITSAEETFGALFLSGIAIALEQERTARTAFIWPLSPSCVHICHTHWTRHNASWWHPHTTTCMRGSNTILRITAGMSASSFHTSQCRLSEKKAEYNYRVFFFSKEKCQMSIQGNSNNCIGSWCVLYCKALLELDGNFALS